MQRSLLIAIVIILSLGVVGFGTYFALNLGKQQKQSNNQVNQAVTRPDWQTYVDPVFGYTIQYPSDWEQKTDELQQIQFSPKSVEPDASVGDIAFEYRGDVFIDVFENPENKSVAQFVDDQVRENIETRQVTVGSTRADYYERYCPFREAGAPTFAIFDYPYCDGSVIIPKDGFIIALQYGPTDNRNTWSTYTKMLETLSVPADPTASWVTETNSRYGYRFKHPSAWIIERAPNTESGVIAHQPPLESGLYGDEPFGAFVVYNNGGAQRKIPESGSESEKPVGTILPAATIDGVPADVSKIEFWDHGLGVDPVPGAPGPGFFRAVLEIDYIPKENSRLPATWDPGDWISLYPDFYGELTLPRMILKTFEFDSQLAVTAPSQPCTTVSDQEKFNQADKIIIGRADYAIPEQTRIFILTWYKVPSSDAKSRPQLTHVIPAFGLGAPNDFVFQEGKTYLLYLKDEHLEPPRFSADQCGGTREYNGTLTTEEEQILKPL